MSYGGGDPQSISLFKKYQQQTSHEDRKQQFSIGGTHTAIASASPLIQNSELFKKLEQSPTIGQFDPKSSKQRQRSKFKKPSIISQASQSVTDNEIAAFSQLKNMQSFNLNASPPYQGFAAEAHKQAQLQGQKMFKVQPGQQHENQQAYGLAKDQLINNVPIRIHSANRLCGTPELKKKTLSDSTVNITANSAAFLIDQSHNVSQIMQQLPQTQPPLALNTLHQRQNSQRLNMNLGFQRSESQGASQRIEGSGLGSGTQSGSQIFRALNTNHLIGAIETATISTDRLPLYHQKNDRKSVQTLHEDRMHGHKNRTQNKNSAYQQQLLIQARASAGASSGNHHGSHNAGPVNGMASDHTLTLIFDSDDDPMIDTIKQTAAEAKSKRLSEIVEDYCNESTHREPKSNFQHPYGAPEQRKRKQKSFQEDEELPNYKQMLKGKKTASLDKLGTIIEAEQYSPEFVRENDNLSNHQSFMHESSIIHLFLDKMESPLTQDAPKQSLSSARRASRLAKPKSKQKASASSVNRAHSKQKQLPVFNTPSAFDQQHLESESEKMIKGESPQTKPSIQFQSILKPAEKSALAHQEQKQVKKGTAWAPPPRIRNLRSNKQNADKRKPPLQKKVDIDISRQSENFNETQQDEHLGIAKVQASKTRTESTQKEANSEPVLGASQSQAQSSSKQSMQKYLMQFFHPGQKQPPQKTQSFGQSQQATHKQDHHKL